MSNLQLAQIHRSVKLSVVGGLWPKCYQEIVIRKRKIQYSTKMLFLMASSSFTVFDCLLLFFFLMPNHLRFSTVVFWVGWSSCLSLKEGTLANYIQAGCTCLP